MILFLLWRWQQSGSSLTDVCWQLLSTSAEWEKITQMLPRSSINFNFSNFIQVKNWGTVQPKQVIHHGSHYKQNSTAPLTAWRRPWDPSRESTGALCGRQKIHWVIYCHRSKWQAGWKYKGKKQFPERVRPFTELTGHLSITHILHITKRLDDNGSLRVTPRPISVALACWKWPLIPFFLLLRNEIWPRAVYCKEKIRKCRPFPHFLCPLYVK